MIETTVPKSWYVKAICERDQARQSINTLLTAVAGQRALRDWWTREAFRLAAAAGWSPYGSHVDGPDVALEFDGKDVAGMPMWERPVPAGEFDAALDDADAEYEDLRRRFP